MAGSDLIKTFTQIPPVVGEDSKAVTGTDVGIKRGLDTNIIGGVVSGTFTPSGLTIGGKITEVVLDSTNWTAVPSTPLANRNSLGIQNRSGIDIKIQFDNTTVGYVGWLVQSNGEIFFDITDDIILYAKAASGTPTVLAMELA